MREWCTEPPDTPLPASLTIVNSRPVLVHLDPPAHSHLPPDYCGVNSRQHAMDDLKGKFF